MRKNRNRNNAINDEYHYWSRRFMFQKQAAEMFWSWRPRRSKMGKWSMSFEISCDWWKLFCVSWNYILHISILRWNAMRFETKHILILWSNFIISCFLVLSQLFLIKISYSDIKTVRCYLSLCQIFFFSHIFIIHVTSRSILIKICKD